MIHKDKCIQVIQKIQDSGFYLKYSTIPPMKICFIAASLKSHFFVKAYKLRISQYSFKLGSHILRLVMDILWLISEFKQIGKNVLPHDLIKAYFVNVVSMAVKTITYRTCNNATDAGNFCRFTNSNILMRMIDHH